MTLSSAMNFHLEDHSTRLLLLRLNIFEMEDFLLCLAFFTPIQQINCAFQNHVFRLGNKIIIIY